MNYVVVLVGGRLTEFGFLVRTAEKKRKKNVKSKLIGMIFIALMACTMTCTMSSCVSVGMNEETKVRVDKALAEVDRVAKILEEYQQDVKSLVDRLNRLIDRFVPEKSAEKSENKSP